MIDPVTATTILAAVAGVMVAEKTKKPKKTKLLEKENKEKEVK